MKRNKLHRLLKFGILLFGVSLFIVACQKDDDLKTNEQNQSINQTEFKISKIGKSKLEKNNKLNSKLTKLSKNLKKNKSNIQNKTVVSSEYGFTIDTDYANYIESADASYHSYTFYIQRDIETDTLENLLLSLKPDGTYKILIITYNTTAQEKEDIFNGINVDLTDKVSSTTINDQGLITDIFSKAYDCDGYVVKESCGCINEDTGKSFHNGETGYGDCSSNCYNYDRIYFGCGSSGGGSTGGGSTGGNTGGSGNGGGSNGGGTSGSGQTNNGGSSNNNGDDVTTTTGPCRGDDCPEEFDNGTPNTPCQELQEVSNTPSKLAKLIDLKNSTSLEQEVGFTRTDSIVGSPNSTVEYQDLIWNAPIQQLVVNTLPGQLYSDYGHTHYDIDSQLSVFSLSDINTIFSLLEGANISNIEFNIFLVTAYGTKYALKFKNLQGAQDFVTFGNTWFSDWGVSTGFDDYESQQDKLEKIYKKTYKIRPRKVTKNHKNEANFARFLNDYNMGLDLYKANDNFSQWEKVNPDGTTTPCP